MSRLMIWHCLNRSQTWAMVAEDLGTADAMRAASDKIVAAARKLMEDGKLSQDEALREAVRQHARDSASLLEAMSSGEEAAP